MNADTALDPMGFLGGERRQTGFSALYGFICFFVNHCWKPIEMFVYFAASNSGTCTDFLLLFCNLVAKRYEVKRG